MVKYRVGIDIGSTSAKTIVLDENNIIAEKSIIPTGWSSVETSKKIYDSLCSKGININNAIFIATGYGRVSVEFANKCITEITCHANGAKYLFNKNDLIIIDIGGQDTKVILIKNGVVVDFLMNDKCSAGTGRFLEIMSNILSLQMVDLCEMAKKGSGIKISSLCTVFAESEVISLIGRGEKRENIAFGIIDSIINKVVSQTNKLYEKDMTVCLTGGLSKFNYISDELGKKLNTKVLSVVDGQFAGAIGAALQKI